MKMVVLALYHFFEFPEFETRQDEILAFAEAHDICGSLLIAKEGMNGTVAGPRAGVDALRAFLETSVVGETLQSAKESFVEGKAPFRRMKVRLKKEIVHLGRPDMSPLSHEVGTYVKPEDWNELIAQEDVRLIDTRNDFECRIGTFEGAENPHTSSFGEFPEYVEQNLDPTKDKRVAMFCTGGIRCEKATSLLLEKGFEEVYHLQGGILQYFEDVPTEQSMWNGECFVFDDRVTVDQELQPGDTECCVG